MRELAQACYDNPDYYEKIDEVLDQQGAILFSMVNNQKKGKRLEIRAYYRGILRTYQKMQINLS